MKLISICIYVLSINSIAATITDGHQERLKKLSEYSYEDLSHENPGCPENSLCSKYMGTKYKSFLNFMKANSSSISKVEQYRKKYGLPVQFNISKDKIKILDAIAFTSECEDKKKKEIYTGIQFLKNLPKLKDISFKQYKDKKERIYNLPLKASPIAFVGNDLYFLLSLDDYLITLKTNIKGKWQVKELSKKTRNNISIFNESYSCEKNKCIKVWDQKTKKLKELELTNGCSSINSRERNTSLTKSPEK
jgi:hypothetical protein